MFLFLTIGELDETIKSKVDGSRLMAWAFTRLDSLGYPQYLRNVSEVICSRFFIYLLFDYIY